MTVGVLVKVDLLQSKRARFTPVFLLLQPDNDRGIEPKGDHGRGAKFHALPGGV